MCSLWHFRTFFVDSMSLIEMFEDAKEVEVVVVVIAW
jgi:hypothetical protein